MSFFHTKNRLMDLKEFPHFQKFYQKALLALDYGTKFTGIATFRPGLDPFVLGYGRIKFINNEQLIKELKLIIQSEDIEVIILGVPRFLDGKESTWTKTVLSFKDLLKSSVSLPVLLQDETLSTKEAEERMKNSPRYNFKVDENFIDEVSATIILEDFIRSPIIEE
jgi:putative Holliday junction resolvase